MDDGRRARLHDLYARLGTVLNAIEHEHREALEEAKAIAFTDGFVRGCADASREGRAEAYLRGWFEGGLHAQAQNRPAPHPLDRSSALEVRPTADDVADILPEETDRAGVVLFAHHVGQKHPFN